jgi:hypothetical protein
VEPRVTPAECALAVALPLTRDEFIRDATSPDKDFVKSVVHGSGRDLKAAWDELYRPKVVDLCMRVMERSRALGATVVTRVTTASLRALLARFPVVSLFAHSLSPPVHPVDVVQPRAILDSLGKGEVVVARQLRDTFVGQTWARDEESLRRQIAMRLEELLEKARAWYASTVRADDRGRPEPYLNRVMLEDCFGPAMRRAPLLELSDGIKTMDELSCALPPGFAGVLDLAACNSVALGEAVKARQPACLVIENMFLARVDVRLVRYALVLNHLARRPAQYTEALTEITRTLIASSR